MSKRHSEEHLSRVTEPRFDKAMCKTFPTLRGFNTKLRGGKFQIKPEPFEVTEAKREVRHQKRKDRKAKAAAVYAATRRIKRRRVIWWR
jgi:hypothetical protein